MTILRVTAATRLTAVDNQLGLKHLYSSASLTHHLLKALINFQRQFQGVLNSAHTAPAPSNGRRQKTARAFTLPHTPPRGLPKHEKVSSVNDPLADTILGTGKRTKITHTSVFTKVTFL